jgi:hypothetical protein
MDILIKEVSDELAKCYDSTGNFIFPEYTNGNHKGKKRISEQESKIIFSILLVLKKQAFSVETPTLSKFSFTPGAKSKRSANHDIVIYKNGGSTFDWAIELNAHNVDQKDIDKDFEKMMLSGSNCLWFHTFENANDRTFKTILSKFENAIQKHIKIHTGQHLWKIVIIVLNKERELYIMDINLTDAKYTKFNEINLFKKSTWDKSSNKFI